MTATLPQQGPPEMGGLPRVRLDARPGSIYCYDVLDAVTGVKVEGDYVGQSRNPVRRDKEHRGQLPQRDGQVREQPWADRIVGGQRILEQGVWTDAELDAAELAWMAHLQPRLNCRDSTTPDRIPIYVQRRQRDERDIAAGLAPRDWSRPSSIVNSRPVPSGTDRPTPSVWARLSATSPVRWARRRLQVAARKMLPWMAVWVVLAVVLVVWWHMPAGRDTAGAALAGTGAVWVGWRRLTRPRRRGSRQRRRRR